MQDRANNWLNYIYNGVVQSFTISTFCDRLNEVHPNIKFTTEIQNNKYIDFLDFLVDNNSTTVATSMLLFANRPTLGYVRNGAALCHAVISKL